MVSEEKNTFGDNTKVVTPAPLNKKPPKVAYKPVVTANTAGDSIMDKEPVPTNTDPPHRAKL